MTNEKLARGVELMDKIINQKHLIEMIKRMKQSILNKKERPTIKNDPIRISNNHNSCDAFNLTFDQSDAIMDILEKDISKKIQELESEFENL